MAKKIKVFRTVFKEEIVAEFLPPSGRRKNSAQKVIILCQGMPSIPKKIEVLDFLSKKGFWVFHPRYRGAWESRGKFLKKSPHQDILDVINQLPKGFKNSETGKVIKLKPKEIFLIGSSFGGPAAILASSHKKVSKIVVFSPVIDWQRQDKTQEPIGEMKKFIKEYFARAYDFNSKDWDKLKNGKFYNPISEVKKFIGKEMLIFHCKDDKNVSYKPSVRFSKITGVDLVLITRGGHLGLNSLLDPKISKKVLSFLK